MARKVARAYLLAMILPAAADASTSDDLFARSGLPAEFAYLLRDFPRSDWSTLRLHAGARFWLQRHAWFRRMQDELGRLGEGWRGERRDPRAYAGAVFPPLQAYLGNLHGHHGIESGTYFPAMSAAEPRMLRGFELLDRDHDAIHGLIEQLVSTANALGHALGSGADAAASADALAALVDSAAAPLLRHLADEEDIVIPFLTLRGDPLELAQGAS